MTHYGILTKAQTLTICAGSSQISMAKRTSYAAHKVLHAQQHADAKATAERWASEKGLTITEEVTVNYATVQVPTPVEYLVCSD